MTREELNTVKENAAKKAAALLATRSLGELLNDWDATEDNNAPEIPNVRGWIMDELERRNPEAFEAWMEGDAKKGPREYFLV